MKLKEFDIILDIKKKTEIPHIEVVQGDNEANVLNVKITKEGKEYPMGDSTIEVAFKRPDETVVIQNNATITDKIRCILEPNTILIPGKVLGEVRIKNDNSLLTTSQFEFYVRKSIR